MFKSWLISNFEVVYLVAALMVIGTIAVILPKDASGEMSQTLLITIAAAFLIGILLFFATSPGFGPVATTILFVAAYIALVLYAQKEGPVLKDGLDKKINTIIIILSIVALIPSFFIARYANRHFEDVVSSRWLFRNSDKDVFASTWKYTINRFFMAFIVFFATMLLVCITVVKYRSEIGGGL